LPLVTEPDWSCCRPTEFRGSAVAAKAVPPIAVKRAIKDKIFAADARGSRYRMLTSRRVRKARATLSNRRMRTQSSERFENGALVGSDGDRGDEEAEDCLVALDPDRVARVGWDHARDVAGESADERT